MKIAVVGLGAVGTHLAAHFSTVSDCTVSALVRKPGLTETTLEARTPNGVREGVIRQSARAADLGVQDVVFLTIKAQHLPDVAPKLQSLIGPETILVPPTSTIPYWYFHGIDDVRDGARALDPDGVLSTRLPPPQVVGCAFWVGATLLAPGVVQQEGLVAGYPLGEPMPGQSRKAEKLSALMTRAGLRAPVRADIRAEIWMKFINSLCWNAVAVLSQAEMSEIRHCPSAIALTRTLMDEAERVAGSLGVRFDVPLEKRISTALAATGHRMSSLQDLLAKRPLELPELIRSFRLMRDLTPINTPTLDAVLSLAELRAHTFMLELDK